MAESIVGEFLRWPRGDLLVAERLAVVVVAESTNTRTRETWYRPGWDAAEVARRVGVSPGRLTNVFASLAAKGVEIRVQRGTDAKGRPVFAYRGAQTTFRLPLFLPDGRAAYADGAVVAADGSREYVSRYDRRQDAGERDKGSRVSDPLPEKGSLTREALLGKGSRVSGEGSRTREALEGKGSRTRDPFPSKTLNSPHRQPDVRAIVAEAVGADDDDEIEQIIAEAKSRTDVRNLPGYLATLADNGHLADIAAEVRKERRRPALEAWNRAVNAPDAPRCPHGERGGAIPNPVTNYVRCTECRTANSRSSCDAA